MKARYLATVLQNNPDLEVMILDGFNGGGAPRDINIGPNLHTITQQDANETADCEGRVGQTVFKLGFGSY